MGKILVEICLISARELRVGLGFGSSLLKHQWFAVGWLDPKDKYCTKIDASRSGNPVWRTKFATLLDDSSIQDSKSVLHVEVYRREPFFLTKRLHGSATVSLNEVLIKYKQQQSSSKSLIEETGCYQLRKTNSSKPKGFVDFSIRLSAERHFGFCTGDNGGVMFSNNSGYNTSGQDYMAGSSQYHPSAPLDPSDNSDLFSVPPYNLHSSMPNPPMNKTNPQMQQPYYPPPSTSSGYMPTYIRKSENVTNISIPSSSTSEGAPGGAGRGYARPGPGFAAGMGAGTVLGAGATLYGGELMSGFDLPSSLSHPSVSISIDPPF